MNRYFQRNQGFTNQQQPNKQHASMFVGTADTGKGSVRIFPIGGTTDVTKNMFVYEYRYDGKLRDILLVDCGIGFPDPDMYGVDLVIPDVRYLTSKKEFIRGLVFSHGHDDHIGAIPYIYPKLGKIPMWGTPLTATFANVKLKEVKIKEKVTSVGFDQELHIGPFRVTFVRMTHSVPDTANLIIETPVGIFYHGSDFKFDFHPLDGKLSEIEKINAVGKKGVLCLLTDCLGSERAGFTPSEQKIGDVLEKEITMCPGKFLFTTQSSNISRMQLAIEIAIRQGREISFIGRSVTKNIEAALDLGYMRFPREKVIRDRDLRKVPPVKQFLIVAGAQGQPESALVRIANDNHSFVSLNPGDTVLFSADPIPGNENAVNDLIDQIYTSGARVSYTNIMEDLHVSGHGSQGDHMLLLSALGPRYVFPIGGTARHVVNYQTVASEIGFPKSNFLTPEEGEVLEFRQFQKPRVVETVSLENILVDGLGVGDVGAIVLHDRQTIAQEGIVVVVVPIDRKSGRIIGEPDIISRGFVYIKDSTALLTRAKRLVIDCLKTKKNRIRDWRYIRELVEDSLQKFLRKETGRQPLIVPVVLEV